MCGCPPPRPGASSGAVTWRATRGGEVLRLLCSSGIVLRRSRNCAAHSSCPRGTRRSVLASPHSPGTRGSGWHSCLCCIQHRAEQLCRGANARAKLQLGPGNEGLVVANPVPVAFWRRELLFRKGLFYGSGDFSLFDAVSDPHRRIVLRRTPMGGTEYRSELDKLDLAKIKSANPKARAFLFWSRMPVAQRSGDNIVLRDQRFLMLPGRSGFQVVLTPGE